ncbi:tyrosine-type recombinase/integrase [Nocardioides sp. 31GB23]|uniref:tyrosine-type recombinase/integrase n=1 Tax=Nocardioides sp. 31GB23 TaxID=3156065 RepID=UPI0032AEEE5A
MASITRRSNGRWRARYRDENGKEHAKHFDRKVDARRWLDQVVASVVRGDYVDPAAGNITVTRYAEQWEAVQVSSAGTRRIVDNALRLHLLPALGHHKIGSVRPTTVQGFVRDLEVEGLSAGTVRNIYDVAARVFAAAVDDRIIAHTPCRKIRLPKGGNEEVVPPTVDEVAAIIDVIDDRWVALIVLLAGSGLRIGEARGLEVRDVDLGRRTIRVERQRLQNGEVHALKSKASRRTVPIGQVVVEELAAHLSAYATDGPLFVDELGRALPYWRWKRVLAEACREAGVDVGSHGLRHFAASALIAGGASVKQVQAFLGHASAVITLRTYAHLWPGDEDRTRNVLDAALGPLADSLRTGTASRR